MINHDQGGERVLLHAIEQVFKAGPIEDLQVDSCLLLALTRQRELVTKAAGGFQAVVGDSVSRSLTATTVGGNSIETMATLAKFNDKTQAVLSEFWPHTFGRQVYMISVAILNKTSNRYAAMVLALDNEGNLANLASSFKPNDDAEDNFLHIAREIWNWFGVDAELAGNDIKSLSTLPDWQQRLSDTFMNFARSR